MYTNTWALIFMRENYTSYNGEKEKCVPFSIFFFKNQNERRLTKNEGKQVSGETDYRFEKDV